MLAFLACKASDMEILPPLAPRPDLETHRALLAAAPPKDAAPSFSRGPLDLIRHGRKAGFCSLNGHGAEAHYEALESYSNACVARARAICNAAGVAALVKALVDDSSGFSTEMFLDEKGRVKINISISEIMSWELTEEGFDFCILHELGHHKGKAGLNLRLWSAAAYLSLLGAATVGALKYGGWWGLGPGAGWTVMVLLGVSYASLMTVSREEERAADAYAARMLVRDRALAGARQALEGAERKESAALRWLYRLATPLGGTHPSTRARLDLMARL
jgi:hypothetical protein